MKETMGELNTAVIVMIAVGVFMAFFFGFIWPALRENWNQESACKSAVCDCNESTRITEGDREYCVCHPSGDTSNTFNCIFKG